MFGSAAALWRMETTHSSLASRMMVGCLLFWTRSGWRLILPDVRCLITFKLSNSKTQDSILARDSSVLVVWAIRHRHYHRPLLLHQRNYPPGWIQNNTGLDFQRLRGQGWLHQHVEFFQQHSWFWWQTDEQLLGILSDLMVAAVLVAVEVVAVEEAEAPQPMRVAESDGGEEEEVPYYQQTVDLTLSTVVKILRRIAHANKLIL